MLERLWVTFKLLLSLALLAGPVALFVAVPATLADPVAVGVAAGLTLLAALPWVHWDPPGRAVGLVGVAISLGMGVMSWHIASGRTVYPKECWSVRRRLSLLCEATNLLHAIGGGLLVALPFALCALLLGWFSLRHVLRSGRRRRPPFVLDDEL